MTLIGFTGGMGSGKTTAIEYFNSFQKSENVKFAQPLYDIQNYAYARIQNVYQRPKTFVKDRKLLQWLGTDWGRDSIKESLWIDLWKDEVAYMVENFPHIAITCDDVRFDNEAQTIKDAGGAVVRLISYRTGERIDTANGLANHKSEAGITADLVDYTVYNNGTIEEFKDSLRPIYQEILGRSKR